MCSWQIIDVSCAFETQGWWNYDCCISWTNILMNEIIQLSWYLAKKYLDGTAWLYIWSAGIATPCLYICRDVRLYYYYRAAYICMYVCMYVYIYIYIYVCIYVYIYICILCMNAAARALASAFRCRPPSGPRARCSAGWLYYISLYLSLYMYIYIYIYIHIYIYIYST